MTAIVHHEMIKASAGTGKTYALVNRYLRLLSLGVEPSRITALTFTRKAAGEFLCKIFLRLSEAASTEEEAARLSRELSLEIKDAGFFRTLLLTLVSEIGQLQLGTIDHFFGRIVSAFPFELGLARTHRIMDDFEQDSARELIIQQLLNASGEKMETFLLQIYKNLTWGNEERNVYGLFDRSLKAYHHLFIETGEPACWGRDSRIFTSPPWWASMPEDIEPLLDEIENQVEVAGFNNRTTNAFLKFARAFREWKAGQEPGTGAILDRLMEVREDLENGTASIKYYTVVDIPAQLGKSLFAVLQFFIGNEIKRSQLNAQSLGLFLGAYDERYAEMIRETGSLVFADLPMLLTRAFTQNASSFTGDDLMYRLDSRTDHWLLDEFQDTSRIQWKVLSRFIDEVLQDPSGQRSFFYVGDVKQSIYAWRGGDPRLFNEIYSYYQGKGSGIREDVRTTSWRSGPAVLDCVNLLFGKEGLSGMPLPDAVKNRWSEGWEDHLCSPKTASMDSYAAWGLVDKKSSLEEACLSLIQETDPLERGLSCAVLMRDNESVRSMTQALRAMDIPASMEGSVHIAIDNVVGAWVRAFLYSLARPAEPFPRQYLNMIVPELANREYNELAHSVREALTGEGYAEAVRRLIGHLPRRFAKQEFLNRRSEQILEAASRFHGTAEDSLEKFLLYLEKTTVDESTIHDQVQVMTVHKAKGLDFDMVVVAGFGPKELARSSGRKLHIERNETGTVEWIMEMPPKQIVQADPCLSRASELHYNDNLYESLCILYVAMTRARRGLYCIAPEDERGGETVRWQHLFESAFGTPENEDHEGPIVWQRTWGKEKWFEPIKRQESEAEVIHIPVLAEDLPQVPVYLQREASPSREAHAVDHTLHPLGSAKGRRFGTRMHAFLAAIDWIPFDKPDTIQRMVASVPDDLRERFAAFLKTPVAREVFQRPERPCRLWREKPYALRSGNILTQGIIDRAMVFLDGDDQPEEVMIFDYKTDQLDPDRPAEEQLQERYATQLERYVDAVGVITGLEKNKICTKLVPV